MAENDAPEGEVFDPFTAPAARKTVVLAAAYTDGDGIEYEADTPLELDRSEADRLLHAGLARTEEQDAQQREELLAAAGADPDSTIPEILAAVGTDKDKAQAALEAEQAKGNKARKSLVSALEAIVNNDPEGN